MMDRRGRILAKPARWGPVAVYIALIFALSSMSNPPVAGSVPNLDKLVHFLEYGGLGCLLAWAMGILSRPDRGWIVFFTALALGAGVGLADEYYQGTVPGRDSSPWDFLADMSGLVAFQVLLLWWSLRRAGSRRDT